MFNLYYYYMFNLYIIINCDEVFSQKMEENILELAKQIKDVMSKL